MRHNNPPRWSHFLREAALIKRYPCREASQNLQSASGAACGEDLNIHHGEMVALLRAVGFRQSTLSSRLSGLITGDKSAGSHIELLGRAQSSARKVAHDIREKPRQHGLHLQQLSTSPERTGERADWRAGSTPVWRTCLAGSPASRNSARYRR